MFYQHNHHFFQHLGEILLQGKGHNGCLALLVHDDVIDQLKSSELLEQNGFLTPDALKDDAETLARKLFHDYDHDVMLNAISTIKFLQLQKGEILYFPDKDDETKCWKGQVSSEIIPAAKWRSPSNADWVSNQIHQAESSIASDSDSDSDSSHPLHCDYIVEITNLQPAPDVKVINWWQLNTMLPASYPFVRAASVFREAVMPVG